MGHPAENRTPLRGGAEEGVRPYAEGEYIRRGSLAGFDLGHRSKEVPFDVLLCEMNDFHSGRIRVGVTIYFGHANARSDP
jgi:hypothetical protein